VGVGSELGTADEGDRVEPLAHIASTTMKLGDVFVIKPMGAATALLSRQAGRRVPSQHASDLTFDLLGGFGGLLAVGLPEVLDETIEKSE
jgi:hypothetical protein